MKSQSNVSRVDSHVHGCPLKAEDGRGVQGVVRLVPAAAAAAVGDPAGLVGVGL